MWFLLPKHPSYFLWYLSLADRAPHQQMDVLGGFHDYAAWMVHDYHANLILRVGSGGIVLTRIADLAATASGRSCRGGFGAVGRDTDTDASQSQGPHAAFVDAGACG